MSHFAEYIMLLHRRLMARDEGQQISDRGLSNFHHLHLASLSHISLLPSALRHSRLTTNVMTQQLQDPFVFIISRGLENKVPENPLEHTVPRCKFQSSHVHTHRLGPPPFPLLCSPVMQVTRVTVTWLTSTERTFE